MMRKLLVALCALGMLSGCSSTKTGASSSVESSLIADFEKNVGDRVFFALDKSDLCAESRARLEKQSEWLNAHSQLKARIAGHCDQRGTREYNLALGGRRANAVKHFLVHHGVDANRLETISYGKERPAVMRNDEEAYAKNRRAVTEIIE